MEVVRDEGALQVFRERFQGGVVSEVEYAQSRSEYASAQASVEQFRQQVAQQEDLLSVLVGDNPRAMPRGKPIVVIAHTVKGKGVERAEFNYKWHTHAPDPQTADAMLKELARNYGRAPQGYSKLGVAEVKEDFYGGE